MERLTRLNGGGTSAFYKDPLAAELRTHCWGAEVDAGGLGKRLPESGGSWGEEGCGAWTTAGRVVGGFQGFLRHKTNTIWRLTGFGVEERLKKWQHQSPGIQV